MGGGNFLEDEYETCVSTDVWYIPLLLRGEPCTFWCLQLAEPLWRRDGACALQAEAMLFLNVPSHQCDR